MGELKSQISTSENTNAHFLDALNAKKIEIGELFSQLRPEIKRLIDKYLDRRIRRRVDASDVAQSAFVDADDRLARFLQERPMEIRSWLFFLAKMKALETNHHHLRSKKRDSAREQEGIANVMSYRDNATSPSQTLSRKEVRSQVREAVDAMPEHYQRVIHLRHVDGVSNREASQILSLSENAASKLYARALNTLQKQLRDS